ncbi:hypothetical protein AVEN_128866-1, partial [Araneus ventricosus]
MADANCNCPIDSSASGALPCSPICHRTRARVAQRSQSQLSSVTNPTASVDGAEICRADDYELSSIQPDTALSPISDQAQSQNIDVPCDSLPNFSIGDCHLTVNDSLIVSVMLDEIVDLVCNDPSACVQELRTDQIPQVIVQVKSSLSQSEKCLDNVIDDLANSIIKTALCEIFSNVSTNYDSLPSEDRCLIDFDVPCEGTEFVVDESIDNELFESISCICNVNSLVTPDNVANGMSENFTGNLPTCAIDESSSPLPDLIDPANVTANAANGAPTLSACPKSPSSGNEDIDLTTKIPPCESDDSSNDTDLPEPSVPNFSLEIDFKNDQLQPENHVTYIESHADLDSSQDSSGIPDSDEIQIIQFTTANNSSLTVKSFLPQEVVRHPTVIDVFSCEYCERKFTSETATHAHIFDVHLETKGPVFQIQESIIFLRNYPAPACVSCKTGFLTLNLLNKHCQRLHSGDFNKFACSVCNFDFLALNNFFTHRCTNEMPIWKPFKCDVCEECFECFEQRASHDCIGPPIFERDLCPDEVQSVLLLPSLNNILDLTLPPQLADLDILSCIYCSEKFQVEEQLAQHIIQSHLSFDVNPYNRKNAPKRKSFSSCKNCGLTFASSVARISHSCLHLKTQIQNLSQESSSEPLSLVPYNDLTNNTEISANPQTDEHRNIRNVNQSDTSPNLLATSPI